MTISRNSKRFSFGNKLDLSSIDLINSHRFVRMVELTEAQHRSPETIAFDTFPWSHVGK